VNALPGQDVREPILVVHGASFLPLGLVLQERLCEEVVHAQPE